MITPRSATEKRMLPLSPTVLTEIARIQGLPGPDQPDALARAVAAVSDFYNRRGPRPPEPLYRAARLGFFLPRDVAKSREAVRELVETRLLRWPSDRALRVLDLGAGLGATGLGVLHALPGPIPPERLSWVAMDQDAAALRTLEILAGRLGVPVRTRVEPVRALPARWDLILLGQVISELEGTPETHAALLTSLLDTLEPDGAMVIIEPALRDRTRHLHALRDLLIARPDPPTLFAPCLHTSPCPALLHPDDWCHEDRAVDLPEWLHGVARAAGLRYQGLGFSYLILRRDGLSLSSHARLRVVSDRRCSKGKEEFFCCGRFPDGDDRRRIQRLARERSATNAAWDLLLRGALLAEPLPTRVRPEDAVVPIDLRQRIIQR